VWTMQKPYGAVTWYPVNDHPSDKARYTITLDVPDKWTGVSNGKLVGNNHVGTRRITQFAEDHPMASYLVTVAIGPYKAYTQTGPHGLPLTYWYPSGKPELLTPLKKTPTTIGWLEKKLGPYPFSRAGVVITPGRSSIESQTMITLAQDNYRYGGADVQEQIAHDLAHAWYGASVSPNDWRDVWLMEGPATYLQARYAVARGWDTWSSWKRAFARNDDYYRELYGPPGAYVANEFGQRNVKYGGALVLERLRGKIGTAAFDRTLRDWPTQNLDKSRGRGSFIALVETETTVTGLDGWFDHWLTDPDTPAA
jgi:aminopeptidase N